MDVTVAVCTFGDPSWERLARERAIPSASPQARTIHVHGQTLAGARNAALERVTSEWICHLDADDELEPGYIDAMATGTADLRAPAVRYVRGGRARAPRVPRVAGHHHDCTADCLPEGNFAAIGTLAPVALLRKVGGWEEWPVYEDWAIWLRCWVAGASIETIPDAIYRAHVNAQSRNRAPVMAEKNRVHYEILAAILPDAVSAA